MVKKFNKEQSKCIVKAINHIKITTASLLANGSSESYNLSELDDCINSILEWVEDHSVKDEDAAKAKTVIAEDRAQEAAFQQRKEEAAIEQNGYTEQNIRSKVWKGAYAGNIAIVNGKLSNLSFIQSNDKNNQITAYNEDFLRFLHPIISNFIDAGIHKKHRPSILSV
jgi:hypothetical protein